jgi:hypothetical protein
MWLAGTSIAEASVQGNELDHLRSAAALAGGQDHKALLDELADIVRVAGREHHEVLRTMELPVASNA